MRLLRCLSAAALAFSLSVAAVPSSWAAPAELPFTQQAFDASQKQGKPILVHVNAPWCPFCAKQRPIIAHLKTEPKFSNLIVYQVDFDTQKDALKAFGVQKQSTLIVFKGSTEEGRSTGVTDPAKIESLVALAVR